MISYCVFTKNSENEVSGLRVLKQVVLINGFPFEIKSIYGMAEDDAEDGEAAIDIKEGETKECLICLDSEKDTVIMPCGHLCVCSDCGKSCVKHK